MKVLRRLLSAFALSVLLGSLLILTAFASYSVDQKYPKLTVSVRVEVEAAPGVTLPARIDGLKYNVYRSAMMVNPSKLNDGVHDADDIALVPYNKAAIYNSQYGSWSLVDWQCKSLIWNGNQAVAQGTFDKTASYKYGGNKIAQAVNVDTLWFEPDNGTNPQLSIVSVTPDPQKTSSNASCRAYQYDGKKGIVVTAPNCIEVTDEKENKPATIYLVLKMKYNPTIEEKEPPEVPEPEYTKKIEPIAGKKNNYRLSLTLNTPEPDKEADVRDIVFVVDTSGSMNYEMNGTPHEIWDSWYGRYVPNPNYHEENARMKTLKTKLQAMVETLANNEQDRNNPKNRVSLITFSGEGAHLVTAFPAKENEMSNLKAKIKSLTPDGGTNYYDAIEKLKGVMGSHPGSEKIVFFVTDGEPTAATPGAALGCGTDIDAGPATIFAYYAAEHLTVDRLYSIYIGNDKGGAALQGFTQRVQLTGRENSEKFMVRAASEHEFNTAMNRFLAFVDKSLYNVKIVDTLSDYVEFSDNMDIRVVAKTTTLNGEVIERDLVYGTDYRLYSDAADHDPEEAYVSPNFKNKKTIQLKLLDSALEGTVYTLSFNVKASGEAMKTLYENLDEDGGFDESLYPDVGDPDTGAYSDKRGFKSNAGAKVSYSYQGESREKEYSHPVIQVQPDVKNAEIHMWKELEGKELEFGEFKFQLYDKNGNPVGEPVTNGNPETGDKSEVIFTELNIKRAGDYEYIVREVIPEDSEKKPGYQYDDSVKKVTINVTYNTEKRQLEANVSYPDGDTFYNKYQPEPVKLSLEAEKVLEGKLDLKPGMFKFYVVECDQNGNYLGHVYITDDKGEPVLDENGNPKKLEAMNGVEGDPGKIVFQPIVFTKPGTYYYKIQEEVVPSIENVTYDLRKMKVVVTVTDQDAKLEAEADYPDGNIFTNKYTVPDPDAQIQIPTVVTGKRLLDGMFRYNLYLYDEENGRQGEAVLKDVGNKRFGYVSFKLDAKYDEENGRIGLKLPDWKGNEVVVEEGDDAPAVEDEDAETVSTIEVDENGITWFGESVTLTFLAKQITPENFDPYMSYDEDKEIIVHLSFVLEDGVFKPNVELEVKGDRAAEAKFFNIYKIRGDIR